MARCPNRALSPEAAALIELDALACNAARPPHLDPAEHARVIAKLQLIAAPYPHLLGKEAGWLIGTLKNKLEYETAYRLRAAQLLIDAGADVTEVERWSQICAAPTRPNRSPNY